MGKKKIFISAGELSGDVHGGNLVTALTGLDASVRITAIGGDNMAKAGAQLLQHIDKIAVMGLTEIIKFLPRIYRMWLDTKKHLKTNRPDLIILIDYPGFNLKLAKYAAKINIPVVYYISPKIWAWKEYRIKTIRKCVDKMICILPFEEAWYEKRGVQAFFVGNPLIDQYTPVTCPQLSEKKIKNPVIGLFPGSRAQEINSLLPDMIMAVEQIRYNYPDTIAKIAMAPGFDFTKYQNKYTKIWLKWEEGRNSEIMKEADILIMASGTAVLEATVHNTPAIVTYKVSKITYWLAKKYVNLKYVSLPNIIAKEEVVPELIQNESNSDNITKKALQILKKPEKRRRMKEKMAGITKQLGTKGVAKRAAKIILDTIEQK